MVATTERKRECVYDCKFLCVTDHCSELPESGASDCCRLSGGVADDDGVLAAAASDVGGAARAAGTCFAKRPCTRGLLSASVFLHVYLMVFLKFLCNFFSRYRRIFSWRSSMLYLPMRRALPACAPPLSCDKSPVLSERRIPPKEPLEPGIIAVFMSPSAIRRCGAAVTAAAPSK